MASIFEKTMRACLENKKAATPATSKKQATSKKLVEKKITSKRFKKESEDEEFDTINDSDVETMDFADDIVAVVDPDIDADEMTSVAQGFQDIIDDTPANEIPETDEYIDDNLYGCPVCGQTFFSDKEMSDGDTCPVCGETANGFVLVGEVAASEDVEETSDEGEEEFDFDGEEIEDIPAEDEGEDEEDLDEAKKARRVSRERKIARRPLRRESRKVARRPMGRRVESTLNLDEKSFNVYLNKFVRENYNNATSFNVVGARYNPQRHSLTLECKINFKSGKTTKANLVCNYRKNASVMTAKDNGVFKVESKRSPFVFKVRTVGNVIKCEGMKYDFVTRTKVENKTTKVRVHSAPLTEKRAVRRPMTRRAMESRRVRRPLSRRVEATRRVRRPSARAIEARRAMRSSVRPARRVRTAESRRAIRRPSMRRSVER